MKCKPNILSFSINGQKWKYQYLYTEYIKGFKTNSENKKMRIELKLNQFQSNGLIETNQNLYNINQDHGKQSKDKWLK